jgi:hypothetical protein
MRYQKSCIFAFCAIAILAWYPSGASAGSDTQSANGTSTLLTRNRQPSIAPDALKTARSWGYQLQSLDAKVLARSPHDLLARSSQPAAGRARCSDDGLQATSPGMKPQPPDESGLVYAALFLFSCGSGGRGASAQVTA